MKEEIYCAYCGTKHDVLIFKNIQLQQFNLLMKEEIQILKKFNFFIYLCLLLLQNFVAFTQNTLEGKVIGENNGLPNALVQIKELSKDKVTDDSGNFRFDNIPLGTYTLVISHLGYSTYEEIFDSMQRNISITLSPDPLGLDEVIVTGNITSNTLFDSSISTSLLNNSVIQRRWHFGTADLLKSVPGTFVDASTGAISARVFSRGISASAEDDLGWFYVSLQEDGLPIIGTQYKFFSPDLFHRVDLMTERLEALRGGTSTILGVNSPGGIYNFISNEGGQILEGKVIGTSGVQGNANFYHRIDAIVSGELFEKWNLAIGGFYRYDEGARDVDFSWTRGGQLKLSLVRSYQGGRIKILGKWLDDHVNRWTGVAAKDWNNPTAAFEQDLNTTALMLGSFETSISDGRAIGKDINSTYSFSPGQGIQTQDKALGFNVIHNFAKGWNLNNSFKFSVKKANWQTSIGNQPLSLDNFLTYLLSGADSPWGLISFRDADTDQLLASVNNIGVLSAFRGEPPFFEYISGELPNDAVMGIAPWYKNDRATELMNQLKVEKSIGNHLIVLGGYYSWSDVNMFTNASFAYSTYEPHPRMLRVTLENPGQPIVQLSDKSGVSNYGGLFYERGGAIVSQFGSLLADQWQISNKFSFDTGLRFDIINHNGEKDRFIPFIQPGGIDGDTLTGYDNGVLMPSGQTDGFDFSYRYISYSLGSIFRANEILTVFARISKGGKVPELNYYFNNFSNVPIESKGTVQKVLHIESGIRTKNKNISGASTLFWSRLSDINQNDFVFDQQSGSVFFTPGQLNTTTTYGIEAEAVWHTFNHFRMQATSTLQKSNATQFTVYNARSTITTSDDSINDFSGNTLVHVPSLTFQLTPYYYSKKTELHFNWRYLSRRQGNAANAFQLPAFSVFDIGFNYQFNSSISGAITISNLFNSVGLMNFFGPNQFGANANQATPEFVDNNPNTSFVVFPILPRSIMLKVSYTFRDKS